MPPKPKMPTLIPATPPVTPAKKSAKPARMTRAVTFAAHLETAAETTSTLEREAAREASDTASNTDTNAEDSTEACIDAQGGKQVAGAKNAGSNKNIFETKKTPVRKPAAGKQSAAQKPAAKKAPANRRAAALKVDEVSTFVESTEDEKQIEEIEVAKQSVLTKMARPPKGRALGKSLGEAMNINSSEQAEGSKQAQTQTPKSKRQPPARNRQGAQDRPFEALGDIDDELEPSHPDDLPDVRPLSQTRFQDQRLPGVEYTDTGERIPFSIRECAELREELLKEVPAVFHQEREHRLANEALELTREYVAALVYQELNTKSLIRQHMEDDVIHKKNGVELSEAETKKRLELLEDLKNTRRFKKILYLQNKMRQMERGLEYFATDAEEKARPKTSVGGKNRKGSKGKIGVVRKAGTGKRKAQTDDTDEEEEDGEAEDEDKKFEEQGDDEDEDEE
ncbi:hypothetical protein MMC34_004043 [Xylographa carneopallida]|nr:hypothetical protein [Xylographa carneopallida]